MRSRVKCRLWGCRDNPLIVEIPTQSKSDPMTEGLICALIFSAILTIIAVRMQSLPVIFISSIGWTIAGMQVYDETAAILPMMLLFMLAVSQFFMIRGERV